MVSVSLTIAASAIQERIRQRLAALDPTALSVIWRTAAHSVLIHVDRIQVRVLEGWLVVGLELETDQTRKQSLEIVFCLGGDGDGDGTGGAARINASTREGTMLAEVWGDDLQRVIWDAVLDAIEVALQRARRDYPREPLTLRGFLAAPDGIQINVIAGQF